MESKCGECKWRKKAEANPRKLLSRLWFWHTKWCPGWKAYQKELAALETKPAAKAKGWVVASGRWPVNSGIAGPQDSVRTGGSQKKSDPSDPSDLSDLSDLSDPSDRSDNVVSVAMENLQSEILSAISATERVILVPTAFFEA
jgi:hypothetical protein